MRLNHIGTKLRQARAAGGRRGSMILIVLMVTVALCLVVGPLMMATLNETKMNERHITVLQAKNASESAVEYGVAQLKLRWDNQTNFPANALITQPLSIPANISTMLWNGTAVGATSVVLTGGIIPNGKLIFIDPTNPANQFDPQRGKLVFARDVMVYAKATASSTYGGNNTAYASEALEVRDGPLFADAIFYNMDLEFHPGPAMNIIGPVHCNGNIWAVAQNNLTFSGPVTSSGNFNVGLIPWPTNWGSSSESSQTGAVVTIPNGLGSNITPYRGSGSQSQSSSYYDSRSTSFSGNYTTWAAFASNRWGGNLLTGTMGVPTQNVVGYSDFLEYNSSGNTSAGAIQDAQENYAYAIIEPNQFNPASNQYHQGAGENQKFARQAGLIVRVYPGPANATTVSLNGNMGILVPANISTYVGLAVNPLTNGTTTATVYKNNVIVVSYTGSNIAPGNNTALVNQTLDYVVANLTTAANQASNNTANLNVVQNNPLAKLTLPAADPTADPNSNLTDGSHYPMMLVNQMEDKASLSNTTEEVFPGNGTGTGNYSRVMQWTSGSNTTMTTYRAVGYSWVTMSRLQTTVSANGLRTPVYNGSTTLSDTYGDTVYQGDVIEQQVPVNATMVVGSYNATGGFVPGALQDMIKFRPALGNMTGISTVPNSSGNLAPSLTTDGSTGQTIPNLAGNSNTTSGIWSGLYDGRRTMTVKTVDIDSQKLRQVLDDNTANYTTNESLFFGNSTGAGNYSPTNSFNGIMYVDFPMNAPDPSRLANVTVGNTTYPGDKMLTSQDQWGLVLANATSDPNTFGSATPKFGVPNPDYNDPTLSANATARTPGFTVATNNALYVAGNYNADGNISTPASPYNPAVNGDNATHPDPACALAADSITMLSGNFLFRTSIGITGVSNGSDNAINTEVCAGLVTGIVPSDSVTSSNESGGAHNFPRFLENWGNNNATFAYRGSLVCLFSSEIGAQQWSGSYYQPPTRNWGYYNQFANGVYPPGTPNSRSYRRVNFEFLTKAQYDAAIAALPTH